MGMLNAQPRFGLEGDSLYDYVTKESHLIGGLIESDGEVWDSSQVATLIQVGKPIEVALISRERPVTDKVDQANEDFKKEPIGETETSDPSTETVAPIEATDPEYAP